jgi:hypothetical protein
VSDADRQVRTFSGGRPQRPALDELGDLFFSAPAATDAEVLTPTGVDDLLSQARTANELLEEFAAEDKANDVEVIAILAGALEPERRDALARATAERLVAAAAPAATPVVRLHGDRATVGSLDGKPVSIHALGRQARDAGRLVLIVAARAASYLDAGRQLPDHCVIPVTGDRESLVEAYRELKVATAATTGAVPEIVVLESGSQTRAEQVYRRLARVAIAHLACTPVFAGAILEPIESDIARAAATETDAESIYHLVAPLMGNKESPLPDASARDAIPAVDVTPSEPRDGQRETLPPVAGVVTPHEAAPKISALFVGWEPESSADLLEAVTGCLAALVPGARGVVNLDGLIDAPVAGDMLVADAAGQPVAVILADGSAAEALRRAVEARAWLATYGRLVARAVPQTGLTTELGGGRAIVLARDGRTDDLEALCPPGVDLVAWTPVACSAQRGLLFRQVLWAVDGPPPQPAEPVTVPAGPPRVTAAEKTDVLRRSVGEEVDDDTMDLGTSPDDDLSADEINDLSGAFDIDELT